MSTPSNPASPWVIVDDFDPSIDYQGPWIWSIVEVTDLSQETAYNNTGHAILPTSAGSVDQSGSFSMIFEGTDIAVYGNSTVGNNTVPVSSSPVEIVPEWVCTVDGAPITSTDPFGTFPYTSFCSATDLAPDTPHTLNVTIMASGTFGFSLDFVRYKPSDTALAAGTVDATPPAKALTAGTLGKTAWVGADDTGISYAQGWGDLVTGKMIFDVTGPSTSAPAVTIGFIGSSLTWHGLSKEVVWNTMKDTTPSLATAFGNSVTGTYVLDGHGAQGSAKEGVDTVYPFAVNLSSPAQQIQPTGNPYNEVVFRTPSLIAGQHVLSLWLDPTDWPLTLDYLTIENGFASTNGDGTISSIPTGSSHKSKGALIGGAVGGVIGGLLLIVFVLFLIRQRTIMRRKKRSSNVTRRWANTDIKLHPVSSPTREGVVSGVQHDEFANEEQGKYAFAFDSKNGRF